MQDFITIASTSEDLMKYVFIGIFVFVALLGNILKMLGFKDSKEGEAKPSKRRDSEDMQAARRRLEELKRERQAHQNANFPRAPKPILFEESETPRSIFDETPRQESKPVFYEESRQAPKKVPRQAPKPTPRQAPKVESADNNAYQQNAFDYDAALRATEKSLAESQIAYEKVAKKNSSTPISANEIKTGEINELMHNKDFLKKSIVISEILDKPLSLR